MALGRGLRTLERRVGQQRLGYSPLESNIHGSCGGLRARAGLLPVEWVMKLLSKFPPKKRQADLRSSKCGGHELFGPRVLYIVHVSHTHPNGGRHARMQQACADGRNSPLHTGSQVLVSAPASAGHADQGAHQPPIARTFKVARVMAKMGEIAAWHARISVRFVRAWHVTFRRGPFCSLREAGSCQCGSAESGASGDGEDAGGAGAATEVVSPVRVPATAGSATAGQANRAFRRVGRGRGPRWPSPEGRLPVARGHPVRTGRRDPQASPCMNPYGPMGRGCRLTLPS
jgi:hypothetical protein